MQIQVTRWKRYTQELNTQLHENSQELQQKKQELSATQLDLQQKTEELQQQKEELHTADGIFQVGTRAMQGAAALRGYADVHVREIRCRHMMSNFLYEVRGDEAAGQCSMLATLATAGGYRIFAQGRYVDRLIRQDGMWRIAHRKVETDQLASDPTGITSIADPEVAVLVRPLVDAARKLGRRVAASE